ncbi:galactonate dehydratase [Nocardiopsis kunsanensis]|uniref:Galactonate dehydratase n=2 Tax=Nocardiopsis kunsanensis TaxID=141693 RepID=A0A918XJ42_9ACTN|nr:enolase C-terminal domain-like protein [Nocardiopsis kunsanensis]GHD34518.1 galactonate dehydratase [Nocardiopsis kunsanensis]
MESIRKVRIWPLPSQPPDLPPDLSNPIAACALTPAGPAWPEHRHRFVLELVAAQTSGWSGPVSETVALILAGELAPGLLGHDPTQHRALAHRPALGRHRHGAHASQAASAVEMACWDLASRLVGEPVPALLGGPVRSQVPLYASALGLDPAHPAAPEAAAWISQEGWWGQKWPLPRNLVDEGPAALAAVLAPLREAAGTQARFMIDGLGRCRVDQAKRLLPVLGDLDVAVAEDLTPHTADLARLHGAADHWGVALAGGEHTLTARDQHALLTNALLDVFQLEPAWCGGLATSLHAIDTAAALGVPTLPHGDRVAASLALASVCTAVAVPALEWHLTLEPLRQHVFTEALQPADGTLPAPTCPGLSAPPAVPASTAPQVVIA